MNTIAIILPLIIEAFKLAPTLIRAGQDVYDGAKKIWESVTAEHPPTPDQQAEYDAAEQAAFDALMKSTADVADVATDGA